jgi:hypothetical protein
MQPSIFFSFPENDLISLKAEQAHAGYDLGENILIQITEVGINFIKIKLFDASTFNSCIELTQLPDLTRRVDHTHPCEQIQFSSWPV